MARRAVWDAEKVMVRWSQHREPGELVGVRPDPGSQWRESQGAVWETTEGS